MQLCMGCLKVFALQHPSHLRRQVLSSKPCFDSAMPKRLLKPVYALFKNIVKCINKVLRRYCPLPYYLYCLQLRALYLSFLHSTIANTVLCKTEALLQTGHLPTQVRRTIKLKLPER